MGVLVSDLSQQHRLSPHPTLCRASLCWSRYRLPGEHAVAGGEHAELSPGNHRHALSCR
jgi:hypothetical protein